MGGSVNTNLIDTNEGEITHIWQMYTLNYALPLTLALLYLQISLITLLKRNPTRLCVYALARERVYVFHCLLYSVKLKELVHLLC